MCAAVTTNQERRSGVCPTIARVVECADLKQRNLVIDAFLRNNESELTRIANRIRWNGGEEIAFDDAYSLVLDAAYGILTNANAAETRNFWGLLTTVAGRYATAYRDEVLNCGITGMSGIIRRGRSLGHARRLWEMEHCGASPTDDELVEYHNRLLIARRGEAQARAQGALATVADLRRSRQRLTAPTDCVMARPGAGGDIANSVEANELVREIIRRCAAVSDDLGLVAGAWLGGHFSAPGQVEWRIRCIAEETRVPLRQVGPLLAQAQRIARATATEHQG